MTKSLFLSLANNGEAKNLSRPQVTNRKSPRLANLGTYDLITSFEFKKSLVINCYSGTGTKMQKMYQISFSSRFFLLRFAFLSENTINPRTYGGLGQLRTDGGGVGTSPLAISETMRTNENSKKYQKVVVELYSIYRGDFEVRSILRAPKVIEGQIMAKFHTFSEICPYLRNYSRQEVTEKKHLRPLKLFFR